MLRLDFAQLHSYAGEKDGIVVPVRLRSNGHEVGFAALVDNGSTFCLFRRELAEALALDLTGGIPQRFRTATGSFEAFGHEVQITVLGIPTWSRVYFFADPAINKNVLGRIGWLDRVRLGLVEHDSQLYLSPYDE